jgi:hypothetical protein
MSTSLILGDFTFRDSRSRRSSASAVIGAFSIKKQVGGVRVIDAMGTDPRPIEWTGAFFPTQCAKVRLITRSRSSRYLAQEAIPRLPDRTAAQPAAAA